VLYTKVGYIGLRLPEMAVGDIVTVIRKAYLPVLLRESITSVYHHVRIYFILGLSNEEAMELERYGKLKL
jgi:hypothetical protein